MIVERQGTLAEFLPAADVLFQRRPLQARVVSPSMLPLLRPGDRVEVVWVPPDRLQENNIVVTLVNGFLVCHRLVRCYEHDGQRWVVTQGDSVNQPDPPLPSGQVVGRVVRIIPASFGELLLWRLKIWAGSQAGRWRVKFRNLASRGGGSGEMTNGTKISPSEGPLPKSP